MTHDLYVATINDLVNCYISGPGSCMTFVI